MLSFIDIFLSFFILPLTAFSSACIHFPKKNKKIFRPLYIVVICGSNHYILWYRAAASWLRTCLYVYYVRLFWYPLTVGRRYLPPRGCSRVEFHNSDRKRLNICGVIASIKRKPRTCNASERFTTAPGLWG